MGGHAKVEMGQLLASRRGRARGEERI